MARRDRKWPLNDGQIPNPNGVRVAPGTGYHRVEGNRRVSRDGPVSDLSRHDSQNFCIAVSPGCDEGAAVCGVSSDTTAPAPSDAAAERKAGALHGCDTSSGPFPTYSKP